MNLYALYTNGGVYSDTLEVLVSEDCGSSWETVYKKANPDLQTADVTPSSFVPEDDEWRNESIDLTSYLTSPQLFVKFRTISDYENNLYVDNININDGQQIGVINSSNDVLGKLVFSENISTTSGINILTIPVAELSAGYYRIKLETGGMNASTPFVKE